MIKKIFNIIAQSQDEDRQAKLYRKLIHHEAEIGGQVFGAIPPGHRREFFCLDPTTWVWHEEWTDNSGQDRAVTTRYDIRPSGIVKSQNGSHYQRVSRNEARNLYNATNLYFDRVQSEIYNFA